MLGPLLAALIAVGFAEPPAPPPSLDAIYKVAAADLVYSVPQAKRPVTRYLSLHGIAEADRPEFLSALSFALNSTSIRGNLMKPVPVGSVLVRLDLESLGWDRFSRELELEKLEALGVRFANLPPNKLNPRFVDIWEGIAASEPYFCDEVIVGNGVISGPAFAAWTAKVSHSAKPVISAHWLFPRLMLEATDRGYYSQLLLLPDTEQALYRKLGVDEKLVALDPRAIHGAAVIKSTVAYSPRELQFLASSTGHDVHWLSRTNDYAGPQDDTKDPLASPAGTSKHDAREILFSTWNGMMGGGLYNGAGKQQNIAPQQIAEDQRVISLQGGRFPASHTKTVANFIKCVDCHGESDGIIGFDDKVIKLLAPPRNDTGYLIKGYEHDPKGAYKLKQQIEEFYRAGLREKTKLIQASYSARVRECTGLDVYTVTRSVMHFFDMYTPVYASEPVTSEQAARELSLPLPVARALWKASYDSQLGILAGGIPVHRLRWEQSAGKTFRPNAATPKASY